MSVWRTNNDCPTVVIADIILDLTVAVMLLTYDHKFRLMVYGRSPADMFEVNFLRTVASKFAITTSIIGLEASRNGPIFSRSLVCNHDYSIDASTTVCRKGGRQLY
jgi:hypothetical protein